VRSGQCGGTVERTVCESKEPACEASKCAAAASVAFFGGGGGGGDDSREERR
jgi:hypothetical protein